MTSKRLEGWIWEILEQTQLDLISLLVNFLDGFGQIMARYDFLEAIRDFEYCSYRLELDLISNFYQLFIWIEANNDQIWLTRGEMSDFEQCSNRLKLDLISLLVNLWYELGKMMNRYVFLDARFVFLSNVWIDSFTFGQLMNLGK